MVKFEVIPNNPGIYAIINLQNGKLWVGQSVNLRRRWMAHLSDLRNGTDSAHLQSAWDKHGPKSFGVVVVHSEPGISKEGLDSLENYWINHTKSWDRTHGYNLSRYARGVGKYSPESCEKISRAQKGKKVSPETCSKISKAIRSIESELRATRSRNGAARRGSKLNEKSRKAISEGQMGEKNHAFGKTWIHNKETRENKLVPPQEASRLLQHGWSKGILPNRSEE